MRLPRSAVALLLVLSAAFACETGPAGPSPPSPSPPATGARRAGTGPRPLGPAPPPDPGRFRGEIAGSRVRNVLREQYVQVYASYGIPYPEPSGTYELDHLVPLELGGDNSNRNLWPEAAAPVPGFHQKDMLENYLHDAVCGGRMALADAQAGIASDWIFLYRQYLQP